MKRLIFLLAATAICLVSACENEVPVGSLKISAESLEIQKGDVCQLTVEVSPSNATDQSVTWHSSDEQIATVTGSGVVTAMSVGTADITATCGAVSAICEVSVTDVAVETLDINTQQLQLHVGETFQFEAIVFPEAARETPLEWTSSDPGVVEVDAQGKATAISQGTATVIVEASGKSAECIVTVKPNSITSISLDKTEITMFRYATDKITATYLPEDADNPVITWTSSNEDCVTVTQDGQIEALAVGGAIITARCGEVYANCSVTVQGIPVESVVITPESAMILVGERYALSAVAYPENAEHREITWASEDIFIATVASDGTVTGVAPGTVTITASAEGVSSSCEITVTSSANIGDFYYSDGTYSTELNSSKEVIGVVFWLGDPTFDDPKLKNDHPGCTHGLVVSVTGNEDSAWQSNYSLYGKTVDEWIQANTSGFMPVLTGTAKTDNLNKTVGYNNTKALEAFNAAAENSSFQVEAINKVVAYRDVVAAPESSSGWYLPSMKELSLLCSGVYHGNIWDIMKYLLDNKNFINERLEMIAGAEQLLGKRYWSSCESKIDRAFILGFDNSFSASAVKNTETNKLRYILAF